jgi:hypothetical protein
MLVQENGTPYAKAPGTGTLQPVTDPDPMVKVLAPVYRTRAWENVDYDEAIERQLAFHQGQIIRQSEWDREFNAPTIDTLTPATGVVAGGTVVTITGTNFSQDAAVTFGGTAGTGVQVVNPTTLKVTAPAKTAGAVNVVVTTASGTATKTNGFTYA